MLTFNYIMARDAHITALVIDKSFARSYASAGTLVRDYTLGQIDNGADGRQVIKKGQNARPIVSRIASKMVLGREN